MSTSLCFGLAMVKGQPSGVDRIPELVDLMLPSMLGPNPDLVIVRTRQVPLPNTAALTHPSVQPM